MDISNPKGWECLSSSGSRCPCSADQEDGNTPQMVRVCWASGQEEKRRGREEGGAGGQEGGGEGEEEVRGRRRGVEHNAQLLRREWGRCKLGLCLTVSHVQQADQPGPRPSQRFFVSVGQERK